MNGKPWYEGLPVPELMRLARGSYGNLARQELADAGCDDIPADAGFVIARLDHTEFTPQADAVRHLRRSKQAASQFIDTLVIRGYLERAVDPVDRRRMSVRLTDRGVAANTAIRAAVDAVDADLERRLTAEELHGLRAGLAALADIREESASTAALEQ
jgi:DNA-binding MarR family transcriptional regulator